MASINESERLWEYDPWGALRNLHRDFTGKIALYGALVFLIIPIVKTLTIIFLQPDGFRIPGMHYDLNSQIQIPCRIGEVSYLYGFPIKARDDIYQKLRDGKFCWDLGSGWTYAFEEAPDSDRVVGQAGE